MMKRLTTMLAALACLSVSLGTPAFAADVLNTVGRYSPSAGIVCITNATAAYTNSTTTPSDITAASCAIPATTGDYSKQYIEACFSADATKATATTGSIGVYVNGALVTASKRFIASAAGQGTIAGCYTVARSSGAAQTVKLQGVSGDTNLFTVAQAVFKVSIIRAL